MARNAINDFEIQHIVKILSELSNCNAFLELTLVNLTKINCQLICMNSTGTSAELKVMTKIILISKTDISRLVK